MYSKGQITKTSIRANEGYEAESIEEKVSRIVNNKEPIKDGAPLIYTDRKDGVVASTNPRTDKWEVAVEGMGKVAEMKLARRKEKAEAKEAEAKGESRAIRREIRAEVARVWAVVKAEKAKVRRVEHSFDGIESIRGTNGLEA